MRPGVPPKVSHHRLACWGYRLWQAFRRVTGDDAYTRYLHHFEKHHAGDGAAPLSQKAFTAQELERRWNGIKRCC